MSLVKKYRNGNKINLYADKERNIDVKTVFGDVYDSALEGLNEEERSIAKSYIDKKLRPAIESSGAEFKYDDSGLLLNNCSNSGVDIFCCWALRILNITSCDKCFDIVFIDTNRDIEDFFFFSSIDSHNTMCRNT